MDSGLEMSNMKLGMGQLIFIKLVLKILKLDVWILKLALKILKLDVRILKLSLFHLFITHAKK